MPTILKIISFALVFIMFTTKLSAETQFESDELHNEFTEVLRMHVKNGHVDYAGIKSSSLFDDYLLALKQTDSSVLKTKEETLAFWINAYNALAIKGIIDGLSPSSFLGRISYFKSTDYEVGGKTLNLYDLERDIIIPLDEPRIHFAIVCASFSCPKLRSEAYLAATLEQQLSDNTIDFINDPGKNEFNSDKKQAHVSKIFDWFEKDFKNASGSVAEFMSQFVSDNSHKKALAQKKYRIKYLKYNWDLNGTPAS
jgi:hypothetical protein